MKNIPVRQIQAAHKEPSLADGFNIRNIRSLLGDKGLHQDLHRHDFFYILALQKGKGGYHHIDFVPHKVADYSVFFMRPGQVHELTLQKGSTGFILGFKPEFYDPGNRPSVNMFRKVMGTNLFRFDKESFKRTLSILNHIFHEHADQQQGFKETIKANLDLFFIELARRPVETSPAHTVSFIQERLDEFVRLLEIHIGKHKKVSDYADMLNISPYQLNAATKTYLRKTSSQMIDQQIILESKRFLLGTSNQVSQIALHLGYEDVSYFIRFFKKHTGYTPESFRQNFR